MKNGEKYAQASKHLVSTNNTRFSGTDEKNHVERSSKNKFSWAFKKFWMWVLVKENMISLHVT